MGDHVVIINAEKVKMTGKKWNNRVILTDIRSGQRELLLRKSAKKTQHAW